MSPQLALWFFGVLLLVGLLFVTTFAACLLLLCQRRGFERYARFVRSGAGGVVITLIALGGLLAAGVELDNVWLGDLLQNGLLATLLGGAVGCCWGVWAPSG